VVAAGTWTSHTRLLADLVDTSVLVRRHSPALWQYVRRGDLLVCPLVRLEMLHGLSESRARVLRSQLDAYPEPDQPTALWARAEEVGERVAGHGVRLMDLLIAAWADLGGHVLVHYDQHYDVIAKATGQPARWVVPRGSL
jgi:predicted nucleic acid-binding protein